MDYPLVISLSSKDVSMALFCDGQAKALGVLEETSSENELGELLGPIVHLR